MPRFRSFIFYDTPLENTASVELYKYDGTDWVLVDTITDFTKKYFETTYEIDTSYKIVEKDSTGVVLREYTDVQKYDINIDTVKELELFLNETNILETNPSIIFRIAQYQNYLAKRTGKRPLPFLVGEEYLTGRYTYDWDGYLFQTYNYPVLEFKSIELFVMSGWKDLTEYLGEPGRDKLWWKDDREGFIFIKFIGLNGYALWLPAPGRMQLRVSYICDTTFSEALWRALFLLILIDIYRNSDNYQFTPIGEKILVNFGERIDQYQQEVENIIKSEVDFKIINVWD